MSTKSARRRRNQTKTRPLTLVPTRPHLTLVDLRHPLPTRTLQTPDTAPHTLADIAEARAALTARAAGIHTPVMAWRARPDHGAHQYLDDGTLLTHTPHNVAPFTATTPCRRGAHHQHPVHTVTDLHTARHHADTCTTPHADLTQWSSQAARDMATAFGGTPGYDPEATVSLALPLHAAKGAQW